MELKVGFTVERNGWKTSNKKPVKNKDLWIKLDKEILKHNKWNCKYAKTNLMIKRFSC